MGIVTAHMLPSGYKLQNYTIMDVLGEGGFGITYLAHDEALNQKVAIKEYFPGQLTQRDQDTKAVNTHNADAQKIFKWGLDRFLAEARILAQLNHANIVRVLYFTSLNNTGYMVMQYEEGQPLDRWVKQFPDQKVPAHHVRNLLDPITEALRVVHALGIAHRDVKPANVYIRENGTPVLLDFGAARNTVSGDSKTMAAIVSAGYSPMEQYSDVAEQGPWTDIYATAGVGYKLVTGQIPPDAPSRVDAELAEKPDPIKLLSALNIAGFDQQFLRGLDAGLSIRAKDRPEDIDQWRKLLGLDAPSSDDGLEKTVLFERPPERGTAAAGGTAQQRKNGTTSSKLGPVLAGASVLALAAVGGWYAYQQLETEKPDTIGETFADALDLGTLTATAKTVADTIGADDAKDVIRFDLNRERLVEIEKKDVASAINLTLRPANGGPYTPLVTGNRFTFLVPPGKQALTLRSEGAQEASYELVLSAKSTSPDTDNPDNSNRRTPTIDLRDATKTARDGILWDKGQERTYTLKSETGTNVVVEFTTDNAAKANLSILNSERLGVGETLSENDLTTIARLGAGDHQLIVTSRESRPIAFAFSLEAAAPESTRNTSITYQVPGYLTEDLAQLAARNLARAQLAKANTPASAQATAGNVPNDQAIAANMKALETGVPYDENFTVKWQGTSTLTGDLKARIRTVEQRDALTANLSAERIKALEPFDVTLTSKASQTLFTGLYAWGADGTIVRIYPLGGNAPLALQPRQSLRLSDYINQLVSAPLQGQPESTEAIIVAACPQATAANFQQLAPKAGSDIGTSIANSIAETAFFDQLSGFCPEQLTLKVLPYVVTATETR
ncbi:MAG: protein kinase [Pseudomonadota bacterium]